jgi:hypothetical protein
VSLIPVYLEFRKTRRDSAKTRAETPQ